MCGELAAIGAERRAVGSAALPRQTAFDRDVVVVLQARVAVQRRMDPRQVIGLAVVLHRQLPVAADLDGEGGVGAAVTQPREVEVGPALGDGRDERSEEHTSELQSLMRTSYAVCWL